MVHFAEILIVRKVSGKKERRTSQEILAPEITTWEAVVMTEQREVS